jgi:hypothetical protein
MRGRAREAAEIVEPDLRHIGGGQERGRVVVQRTEQAKSESRIGHPPQLLFDPLQRLSQRGAAAPGVVDLPRAHVEPHGMHGGEPPDRARQIDASEEAFLPAVAFDVHQHAG